MTDLGNCLAATSNIYDVKASAINDGGQIAGSSDTNGTYSCVPL